MQALPISLATTLGISVDFFSCSYLDVSVRRVRFAYLCIQYAMTYKGRVSPFGNLRIKARLLAPRSLSQATTSFIACNRQGIHHMHLFAWPYNVKSSLLAEQSNITSFISSRVCDPIRTTSTNRVWYNQKPTRFPHTSCWHNKLHQPLRVWTTCLLYFSRFLKNDLKQFLSKSWYLNHVSLDQA